MKVVIKKPKPKVKPKVVKKMKEAFAKKKEVKKKIDLTKKKKIKKKRVKKTVSKKKTVKKKKPKKILPPPVQAQKPPPKKAQPPPKPVFGLNKNSVVKGKSGGFNVRVGNTIAKEMELEFTNPDKVTPYQPEELYTITTLPKLIYVEKPEYTKEARAKGIEGLVILELDIDEDGDVRYIKVLKKLGFGLEQNALEAVKKFKYKPAMQGKVAVAVKKTVKIRFLLDD